MFIFLFIYLYIYTEFYSKGLFSVINSSESIMLCCIILLLLLPTVIHRSSGKVDFNYNKPKLSVCAQWNPNAITIADGSFLNERYTAIFIDKENTKYVIEQENEQVLVWQNGSSTPTRNITDNLIKPSSLFVDVNGHIYVDNGDQNKQVDKWTSNSTYAESVISTNGSCTGLFIDENQSLYCSMEKYHLVVKVSLTNQSKIWTHIAGTGCSGPIQNTLDRPHGIFVDSDFGLYVADTYNNRIQYFAFSEPNGRTLAGFGSSSRFLLNRPTGIILDGYNCLYIVDSENHRIARSIQDGFKCIIGCTGMSGATPNQLNYPHSMAFDNSGNIIVTDWNNRRIQLFYLTSDSCGKSICYFRPTK